MLSAKGRQIPDTVTDVELILHAYHVWGEDCVDHLIGDFSFAIWDARQQKLFCARDHMGVKPFYYFLSDKLFIFASDVGALLAMPEVPRRLNEARIADFLVEPLEGIDKTSTFYLDILRFPPAQCMVVSRDQRTVRTYWELDPTKEIRLGSDDEYAEAFLEVFTEAVRCRLRSPDRVGAMLSGGLDSSSIVGVARDLLTQSGQQPLRTFSAIADDEETSEETHYIRAVLGQGNVEPHLIKPSELASIADDLGALFAVGNEPFDFLMTIPQAMYILARREGLKVLLDGVDGDLIVSHGEYYLAYLIRQGHWLTAVREATGVSDFYRQWGFSTRNLLYTHSRGALIPGWLKRIRREHALKTRLAEAIASSAIRTDFADRIELANRMRTMDKNNGTPRSLKDEHMRRLKHIFLTVAAERYDRAASTHSIESRHPYLDKRLVELSLALPWQQKIRNGWTKFVNRTAMARTLTDEVRGRPSQKDLSSDFVVSRFQLEIPQMKTAFEEDPIQKLGEYIDLDKAFSSFPAAVHSLKLDDYVLILKLLALARWFQNQDAISNFGEPEVLGEVAT
jgi:asparagine synthase (glutamine-hydrolysing)